MRLGAGAARRIPWVLATALVTALTIAGCSATPSPANDLRTLVVDAADSAASGDLAAAESSIDEVETRVVAARDAGGLPANEADEILATILLVRADLAALAVPVSTPAPEQPTPEQATEPTVTVVPDDVVPTDAENGTDTGGGNGSGNSGPGNNGADNSGPGKKEKEEPGKKDDPAPGNNGPGKDAPAPGDKEKGKGKG